MNNPRKFLSYKTASNYNFIKNWNKIKQFLNDEEFVILCNNMIERRSGYDNTINDVPLFDIGRYNDEREDLVFYKYEEEIIKETKEMFRLMGKEDIDVFFDLYIEFDEECKEVYENMIEDYKFIFYEENKNNIWWLWKPIGECHSMGKLLLYLAKKVEPTENWQINCSIAHTTVWNGDEKKPKFFDLNFFWEDDPEYYLNEEKKWIPCGKSYEDFLPSIFGVNEKFYGIVEEDYIMEYNRINKNDNIIKITNFNLDIVLKKLLTVF